MTWPARLKLRSWAPVLEGEGERLTLKFEAYRPNPKRASGESWRGEVQLELDRHMVRKLAEQIREMQTRDRDRLARERARLIREVEPLRTLPAESQEAT